MRRCSICILTETIEIEELRDGELVFVPWTRVNDFSESDHFERHFVLEAVDRRN